ncbi:hypothetical protein DPMN_047361 [Dreissena polymorpha]|uniref:Uncharacterized protein n=1 Tax=Dreissena polymorpha TaxID=45954 RepID=A0A9D4I317_DREPO|nr:hypothetical protein DPMN_047361 [Dreissena polymorpha]
MNREQPGRHRSSTGAHTDPCRATGCRRWCPCGAPVNAGRVLVNRRSAGTPPPFTGALPGHYRRLPGLNRGVVVSLSGSDASIAPVSTGGVTCSIEALPATTGALFGALSG